MRAVLLLIAVSALAADPPRQDLFTAGQGGYLTYRIPGLVAQGKVVLAYAEARKDGFGDWADIDVVLRRSTNGGRTWAPMRVLADAGTLTANNPIAIADKKPGRIHFLYCVNYEQAYYMRSEDGGLTFSAPREITSAFTPLKAQYNWNVIATGPGHGIQLRNGRLLVAVWLSTGGKKHRPSRVSTLFSDDGGGTWHTGDLLADMLINPSETYAVELNDDRVMLNIRSENTEHRRAVAYSPNGATNWSAPTFLEELKEPVCMASLIRHPSGLLFSNPDTLEAAHLDATKTVNRDRKNLTVQWSPDDGRTWPAKRVIEPGLSGYSDLAVTADNSILCLFERGSTDGSVFHSAHLSLARFTLAWLRSGTTAEAAPTRR